MFHVKPCWRPSLARRSKWRAPNAPYWKGSRLRRLLFLLSSVLRQCHHTAKPAQIHSVNCTTGHNDHGSFFFQALEEHVHGSQMEGCWVLFIRLRSFGKRVGDLLFRFAQDYARLSFAPRLRLPRHGVFQVLWNDNISDLDRLHGNPQGVVRSSMIFGKSLFILARPMRISARSRDPITTRSAVCAAQLIAER